MMVLILSGCTKEQETIEGYWMSENGETISFNSNGKAISDGISMDYSLYGKDNLSISFWGMASEYRYTVKNDVLTLIDLKKNATSIFYRDEEKQQEIQTRLNQIKVEKEKQEKLAQEKKEYAEYVNKLKNRLESIDSTISYRTNDMSNKEERIIELENDIQDEYNEIAEYEKRITELEKSTSPTKSGDIGVLRGSQEVCYGTIETRNVSINTCKSDIDRYKKEIKELEKEKEDIITKLKELGEYVD